MLDHYENRMLKAKDVRRCAVCHRRLHGRAKDSVTCSARCERTMDQGAVAPAEIAEAEEVKG